ncbi:MAG TPA: TadE/TadG family type IV pilus assembly protein [Rhizomicrobium sp.]
MICKARWEKLRRRLRADSQKGSAALEFAMVAPVFFVLFMGIIEAGIMFFAQSVLQNAVTDAGRLVRTGQVQGVMTQAQFKTQICNETSALLKCDGNLQVDVEAFPSYSNVSYASPLNADKTMNAGLNNYNTGTACDVVLVRAFYTWTIYTPGLTWFLVNMAGGNHLLSAAAAFRNEPFDNNAGGC